MEAKTSQEYSEIYDRIPLKKLNTMYWFEILLLAIEISGIIIIFLSYLWICFDGIVSTTPIVLIDNTIWRANISQVYNLTWGQIVILLACLFIRKKFREQTKISVLQSDKLHAEENVKKVDLKEDLLSEISPKIGLRNIKLYYVMVIVEIILQISYLNYFPRGQTLFPSWDIYNDQYVIIRKPPEYATFFWINTIFGISILYTWIFLLLFSIRQLKDMYATIKLKQTRLKLKFLEKKRTQASEPLSKNSLTPVSGNLDVKENDIENENESSSKPWNLMTIEEKRVYQMESLRQQKIKVKEQQQAKLKQMVQEAREKRRLGNDLYLKKKKEQKKLIKNTKSTQEKKDNQQQKNDHFDFR